MSDDFEQIIGLWISVNNEIMDIYKSMTYIQSAIMDTHNSTMDIQNAFIDIQNSQSCLSITH